MVPAFRQYTISRCLSAGIRPRFTRTAPPRQSSPSSQPAAAAVPLGRLRISKQLLTAQHKVKVQARTMAANTTSSKYCVGEHFFLDPFAQRQWDDPDYKGGRIHASKEEFTKKVNEHYAKENKLADGYAPFCKHVFVPSFVDLPVQAVEITEANKAHVEHGYIRRTPKELPVLARFLPESKLDQVPVAKYLDIILYSREQIVAERVAQGDEKAEVEKELPNVAWGIISIKAQDEDHEVPMQPITMMRNALGKEEGGSGVPLDRQKYEESVAYWDKHVTIQA